MPLFRTKSPVTRLIVGSGSSEIIITRTNTFVPEDRSAEVVAAASAAGIAIYKDNILVLPVQVSKSTFPVEGIEAAETNTPLVFRKGDDGVFRPEPAPTSTEPLWGDMVRFGEDAPDDSAPTGAVHVDLSTGTVYRLMET